VERYRKAYGGATADYRAYADADLETIVSVIAVRADSPGLTFGQVADAKDLGLEKPPYEIVDVDGAECRVGWQPIVIGQDVTDDKEHVDACQKSQDGLTVFVQGGGLDGQDGLDTASKLASAAFDAVK
jgi:hypothetical protein